MLQGAVGVDHSGDAPIPRFVVSFSPGCYSPSSQMAAIPRIFAVIAVVKLKLSNTGIGPPLMVFPPPGNFPPGSGRRIQQLLLVNIQRNSNRLSADLVRRNGEVQVGRPRIAAALRRAENRVLQVWREGRERHRDTQEVGIVPGVAHRLERTEWIGIRPERTAARPTLPWKTGDQGRRKYYTPTLESTPR